MKAEGTSVTIVLDVVAIIAVYFFISFDVTQAAVFRAYIML